MATRLSPGCKTKILDLDLSPAYLLGIYDGMLEFEEETATVVGLLYDEEDLVPGQCVAELHFVLRRIHG